MSTSARVTPGERRELRSVVRQRMRVLRAEVKQRELELVAEADTRLIEKYREEDRLADELGHRIADIGRGANQQLAELLKEYERAVNGKWRWCSGFETPRLYRVDNNRSQLRQAMVAGIKAQVMQAQLDLDRREADLLTQLAMESLETSAAREFLGRIPTVAELVPSRRLREIEAQFDAGDLS